MQMSISILRLGKGLSKGRLHIFNAITYCHPGQPIPVTRDPGKSTLDSIFCSDSLLGSKCGYFPIVFPFDHLGVWVDLPYTIALGHESPPIVPQDLLEANRKALLLE